MNSDWTWWKHGVIYHIYPNSFFDSNNDGIGDIPGINEKIDYLHRLGVDALWLSPINTSPMYDFGYDISDYRSINPRFGTMEDLDRLIDECHRRNIRIIIDMVLNHTSYLHPWFLSSRSSRSNPKRDWYIWRDADKRGQDPPNNWISIMGKSAWKWDEMTCQYYLHSFLEEQPDLNWHNPAVKEALFGEIRFWLDRGVDGFRLDVINYIIKDKKFRNNPTNFGARLIQRHRYNRDRPETHEVLRDLRKLIDEYDDTMLVGEVATFPPGKPELSAQYLGNGNDELNLAFDFSLLYCWWNARKFFKAILKWQECVPDGGWPCNVFSNHDQSRAISKYGRSGKDETLRRARVLGTLLLTLRGTPFIYYGEEIGLQNGKISRKEICDPLGKRYWPFYSGRDKSRTPMQWSPDEHAGFSKAQPWLPVNDDYLVNNVEVQEGDPYSLLNHYRDLIKLRRGKKALNRGDWIPRVRGQKGVIAYYRQYGKEKIAVVLNFTGKERTISLGDRGQWRVLHSTHYTKNANFISLNLKLHPREATVIEKFGEL